jgi:D-serine deaminase-like pyridoxal phosphate-dependent protein
MADYAAFADEHDIGLRSHIKTHKTPDLAHRQQELTAGDGILCQTLSEVEIRAQSGIDDIYLSYMVVEDSKLDRLVRMSEKLERFATTVDGPGNIHPLQNVAARHDATVGVILEFDIGMGRVGVPTPERAVELAELIDDQPDLRFDGVMSYEAHVAADAETEADFERVCRAAMDRTAEWVERIETEAGLPVNEVKVGGTSTSKFSGSHPIVTEINPGMYPFNDIGELNRRQFELTKEDCAVTVLTTVITRATDDRAVADAGSKSISMDIAGLDPLPKHRDDVSYERSSEEHGWLDVSEADDIRIGDSMEFIVPHVCTTINLHDTLVGVRDGRVEEVWEVQARGKVK